MVEVSYVTGCGRSGSTLFGDVLGEVDGFVPVGEMHVVWERGLISNESCDCGRPFRECPFWTPVFEEAFGGMDRVDPHELIRHRETAASPRHVPLLLAPSKGHVKRLAPYLDGLYRAINTVSGGAVVVDTSKFTSYGLALGLAPSVDLRVVHLVRDARGGVLLAAPQAAGP